MLKPDLIEFKPKTLAKSEEVNYNFEQMGNYVFGTADELKALINSTVSNLNLQIAQSIFTGKVEKYAGNVSDIPNGWLLCDGREVSREEYRNLYNKIGIKYGKGNGVTTFNVPNYIGKFLEGGTEAGIVKEAGLPNIKGSSYYNADTRTISNSESSAINTGALYREAYGRGHSQAIEGTGTILYFDASLHSSIYSDDCNTVQPPSITVLYIIKT